jgi:hypothetical protein
LIQLHYMLLEKTTAALWLKLDLVSMSKDKTSKMHVSMKLFSHKLQEGGLVTIHLSIFREIVFVSLTMELNMMMKVSPFYC